MLMRKAAKKNGLTYLVSLGSPKEIKEVDDDFSFGGLYKREL